MGKSIPTNGKSKSANQRTEELEAHPISNNLNLEIGHSTPTSHQDISISARFSFVVLSLLTASFLTFQDRPLPLPEQNLLVFSPSQINRLKAQFQNASQESALRLWDWIHSRSEQAGAFSEEALSWRGKWRSIQPWLPWGDKNADRAFLQSIFHKHLFEPSELEDAIRIEWATTQMRWDELENLFLIQEGNLNHDLIGDTHNSAHNSGAKNVRKNVSVTIPIKKLELDRIQAENHQQTIEGVGQVVVAEVSSEIFARALTRLAVSMGILSTGASSSAYTFGAGALLGLIIDQCYTWIQNPEQKLELELKLALELLADEVSKAHLEMLEEQMQIRMKQWNLYPTTH